MMCRIVFAAVCAIALAALTAGQAVLAQDTGGASPVRIRSFQPVKPLSRAGQPAEVAAVLDNVSETPVDVEATLVLPEGVALTGEARATVRIADAGRQEVRWTIQAAQPETCNLKLEVTTAGKAAATSELAMLFLPPVEKRKLPYIPAPEPVKTDIVVGAHNCPLWEADKPHMWSQLLKHPERTPALGFYAQENPEVADWETKWAAEHGVNFFIYCWYRASQGEPVTMSFESAMHDALFKSKFVDHMKFTIMWENQTRGRAGVADERDLMENLLPFWMENYFKHPSYLKMDNKPVLFIYRPEFLIQDLGSEENVVKAFNLMRQACRDAGFDGLYLLGEYRGLDPEHLKLMKRIGLDYTFAYCWHVANSPKPDEAIAAQLGYIRKTQELGILPQVVTVSQAWSGWADEGSIWKIPPKDFKKLLTEAKAIVETFPGNDLGRRMLLLDNWNEWGEGHYIAPYREYGFGYLDAVREVFSDAPAEHVDLLPEDIGMGPYDTAYITFAKREDALRARVSTKANKAGAVTDGLVAWWAFDEDMADPVALDYSGHRLGGMLREAKRGAGVDGNALLCEGGTVEVPSSPLLSVTTGMTVECWVKTDNPDQGNAWIVNRIFGGGTATGFRLGILEGKPCFEIPVTDWSHYLKSDAPLVSGQWTHLAGTFDGETMRIYVNGEERGTLSRPGPIHTNEFHLCLGNYEIAHQAHFAGLLDEVRLYDRALSADEVKSSYAAVADKQDAPAAREDIPLADFEGSDYGSWKAEGEAFGAGPAPGTLPGQMPVEGFVGKGLVNSFNKGDGTVGTLTSPPFTIERKYIRYYVGGGGHAGQTCMNLLVDGQTVRTVTGSNTAAGGSERLTRVSWDVSDLAGKTAVIQIVDNATGGWGHINVDDIVQTDKKPPMPTTLTREIVLSKPYLSLPVEDGAPKALLTVEVDGQPVRRAEVELSDDPQFQFQMNLGWFKGKTAVIRAENILDDSRALKGIALSDGTANDADLYGEKNRPQFHFTARQGWLNDPNGLVYHDGRYHLFFQHNPYGRHWGNMHWGHAMSADLVRWVELPIALYPDKQGTMFSGSAVMDTENTAGFNNGANPALVCIYTAAGGTSFDSQGQPFTQGIAYSTNGGMTFEKYEGNPVLGNIVDGNRDPKVFRDEAGNRWLMALYLNESDFAIFASKDLKKWDKLCDVEIPGTSECPEFFEIPVEGSAGETRHVFYGGNGRYLVGKFENDAFTTESGPHPLNFGNCFYASQTYNNIPREDGRRILVAWGQIELPGSPGNQMMDFPIELTLRPTDEGLRLFARPVREIAYLYTSDRKWNGRPLGGEKGATVDIAGELLDVDATVELGTATQIVFDVRGVKVTYDVKAQELSCLDKKAPLKAVDGRVTLRMLVDRASIEIFANDGEIYMPMGAILTDGPAKVTISATGGEARLDHADAHKLRSAWERIP